MRTAWIVAVAAAVCLAPRVADACSYGPMPTHELDPAAQAVDTTPPSAIGETTYTVERGGEPESDGCEQSGTSCDGIGSITVHLGEVTDDQTNSSELGYRIEVVSGSAPSDSTWPTSAPVRAGQGGTLYFHFSEDSSDEPIDFTFRIRALDLAGNVGPPIDVRIRDDGASDGCRLAPRALDLSWALILLALIAIRPLRASA